MNTKQEQIKKLSEGRNEHIITWLSLEDWEELPSEDVLDDIENAWHEYGDDTPGFVRYVRYILREEPVTAKAIYRDLIRNPDEYDRIDDLESYYAYADSLIDRYDVYGPVVHEALRMMRANSRNR